MSIAWIEITMALVASEAPSKLPDSCSKSEAEPFLGKMGGNPTFAAHAKSTKSDCKAVFSRLLAYPNKTIECSSTITLWLASNSSATCAGSIAPQSRSAFRIQVFQGICSLPQRHEIALTPATVAEALAT